MPPTSPSPLRLHAPWVALALAAVLVALAPLGLGSAALGHPYGDLVDHYWGTWWFGRELLAGRLPLHTNVSHWPDTLTLWYVDPVGALLALPFRWLGFPGDWNVLVILQVAATTLAAYAVGFRATRCPRSALVAAMVAGPSPYALGLVHSGLSEYLGLAPSVLYVGALVSALGLGEPPSRRAGWIAGVLLGVSGLQAPYYLVFGALLALCGVPGAGWRARAGAVIRIGLVAGVVASPALVGSVMGLGEGAAVTEANAPGWMGRLPATDVLTFFRPGAYYFPDTPRFGNPGILHVNYLGWVALACAVYAGRAASTRMTALYGVLALGPRLAINGWIATVAGASVVLPLGFLYFPGSPLGFIHQPYRLVALLLPLLALAAARGAARLPAWARPLVAAAVLAETLLVSPAPWPVATRPIDPPPSLAEGPRLDWPPDGSTWNRDYLTWATEHGQPIPYGVNVFLGATLREDPLVDALLRSLDRLDVRARNRDVPFAGPLLLRPKPGPTRLPALGLRWIVVHKAALSPTEWARTQALLVEAFGAPASDDPAQAVWAVATP